MPRYYFDLDDHDYDRDKEGQIMADDGAAQTEAVVFAGAYLRDDPGLLAGGERFVVIVRDEAGETICKVVIKVEIPERSGLDPSDHTTGQSL